MSRVLVIGGSGFIGTNLVQHHVARGETVLNADIRPPRCGAHANLWRQVDIMDQATLQRTMAEFSPEYIYHMAARTDLDGQNVGAYATNVAGVSNVVRATRNVTNVRRVIFASSMLVCRLGYQPTDDNDCCPDTIYGQSKVLGERVVRDEAGGAFDWVIVRPTSIWGPWFDVPYKSFFHAVERGHYVHPKECDVRRSYGFVLNVVFELDGIQNAPDQAVRGKTFYLADYVPTDTRRWANLIRAAFGKTGAVPEVPLGLLKAGARAGDLLKRLGVMSPPLTSRRVTNLVTNGVLELGPVKEICGPIPYGLGEAVTLTVQWMRGQGLAP